MIQKHWDYHNGNKYSQCYHPAHKIEAKFFFVFVSFGFAGHISVRACVCLCARAFYLSLLDFINNTKTVAVLLQSVHHFTNFVNVFIYRLAFVLCTSVFWSWYSIATHTHTHSLPRNFLQCYSFLFEFCHHHSHASPILFRFIYLCPQCTSFLVQQNIGPYNMPFTF